jgi:hypothetical protein
MVFRLTSKAKVQLNVTDIVGLSLGNSKKFFVEWNVDVVILNHKKYFLFTENVTLFSIFKHAKGINSIRLFEQYVGDIFAEIFNDLIDGTKLETVKLESCVYSKTENNNVRRAQIDHVYHAKHLIEDGRNTFDVNRYPVASIGFKQPVDYFIEEMGKVLAKDGGVFIEDCLRN